MPYQNLRDIGCSTMVDSPDTVQLLCEGCLIATILYESLYISQCVAFTGFKAARIVDNQGPILLVIRERLPDVVAASPFSTATNAGLSLC